MVEGRTAPRGKGKVRRALDAMRLQFQLNSEANGTRVPVATPFAMDTTAKVEVQKKVSNLVVDVQKAFIFVLSRAVVETILFKSMANDRVVHLLPSKIGQASMLSKPS